MIKKILIANRGEIAIRIIRACRELGIKNVAIYSDEDAQAMHVRLADEAYHIGPPSPRESYLNMEKIVDTAKKAGADAVHPGYGFLSENADFIDLCEKAGIIFIGPKSETMRFSGDKMAVKTVAKKIKIPVVPASDGILDDVEKAVDVAEKVGYPVLIKSAFGGGGRGIRLAQDEKQLRQEFEMSSNEAKAAYGRAAMFVEKFLPRIRHIEFQLVRDSHGNAVYLFERECSIQRRYQKLVEMAPSSAVDEKARHTLGNMVVKLGNEINYLNAGTVEFICDEKKNFYLIEINSRLQVEHPVTELVTGVDLLKLQIHIASGEPIPFKQSDLKLNGCAIECRINAEDPLNDFAPYSGPVPSCIIPYGPGIRVDTYLYPGCTVSGYYDSLVAKLLAWGRDFNEARLRVKNALNEFYIEGIQTTIPLHKTIMDDPAFIAGDLSTDYIDRFKILEKAESVAKASAKDNVDAIIAAALLHSVLVRGGNSAEQKTNKQSRWKETGRFERSFSYGI
ncbi:MAG: acetyl-CoA/propionyl-CoA carboxylase [Candidatus Nitrosomirales archaeon]|jgi:acetyl-CoA/propionyl-CoA carboxylase